MSVWSIVSIVFYCVLCVYFIILGTIVLVRRSKARKQVKKEFEENDKCDCDKKSQEQSNGLEN